MNRFIAGIFVPGVDDAPLNPSQLMQIVFNEIVSEYSCFTSMEACSEALLKFERDLPNEEKLFSSIEDRASGKDLESSELKIDPSLIVFYQVLLILICFLLLHTSNSNRCAFSGLFLNVYPGKFAQVLPRVFEF